MVPAERSDTPSGASMSLIGAIQVRKLIAVLEANSDRMEAMRDWLLDRLYMYENLIDADPDYLLRSIRHRLDDVLVLCIDLEPASKISRAFEDAERAFTDFLLALAPRFPILI